MRTTFAYLWLIAVVVTLSVTTFAYSGGTGTEADPYQIATPADLIDLGNTPTDYDKSFILTADIDLANQTLTNAVIAPNTSLTGEFQGNKFAGVFSGNGHVISNLTINASGKDYVGLFGAVVGQINNLSLVDANVQGRQFVGGLVGRNELGTITSCYATGTVIGTGAYIGGMVGYIEYGTIASCYATGEVSGSSYVGSLVGESDNRATITSCYATGTVIGTGAYIGGLMGGNGSGTITSCCATGTVIGDNAVGGLVGSNASGMITSCYATGLVSGIYAVGGLVGFNEGGSITDSFWDMESSGQAYSAGGIGRTTAQMKTLSTFTDVGWDFATVWMMCDGKDYPHLQWEGIQCIRYSGGTGTEADPYQIATAADLISLGQTTTDYGMYFIMTADIDLAGQTFTKAIIAPDTDDNNWSLDGTPFTGHFNGNGHVIRNLSISTLPNDGFVGLFGFLEPAGEIKNLGVENIVISGGKYATGGLIGWCAGSVSNCFVKGSVISPGQYTGGMIGVNNSGTLVSCYTTGSVNGITDTGGLIGINQGLSDISECFSTSTVTGTLANVGGLIGQCPSVSIESCYATGNVKGGSYVGGLIGNSYASLKRCYATGNVSGESDSLGGLCGWNNGGTLNDCYSTGSVVGGDSSDFLGGLCGMNAGLISKCYATGEIIGGIGSQYLGGLCGGNTGNTTIIASFWDIQTSGMATSNGGTPAATAQMKMLSTFTDAGWDFVGETVNGTADIWRMPSGEYPILSWQSFVEPGVYFADANLKAAVEEKLGVTNPTAEDMLKLTYLNAKNKGITSLIGLETALNLTILYLHQNAISDITPLAGLNKLTTLNLYLNNITNIAPLPGLTKLSYLSLSSNTISDISALAPMTNLVYLYMASNQINNFSALTGNTKFKEIYATRNAVLTKETYLTHIPTIRANNPKLAVFQYDPGCQSMMGGDANQDCRVNLSDLAMMAADWLKCNHIYEEMCP